MRSRTILIGAGLALGACAWLVLRHGGSDERGTPAAAAAAGPGSPGEAPVALVGTPALAAERAELAPEAAPAPPPDSPERVRRILADRTWAPAVGGESAPDAWEPERWLTGRLLGADGAPARGDVLSHSAHDERLRQVGSGDVALGPYGDFRIPVPDVASGMRLFAVGREHAALDRWFELAASPGTQDVGVLELAEGGSILGEASLGGADPELWSVLVMAAAADVPAGLPRRSARTAYLDGLGRFVLPHVAAGPATVTLGHPLLGVVDERRIEVRDGQPTRVVLVHDGPDPARTLVVAVDAPRTPRPGELLLERGGTRIAPESVTGMRALFTDLTPELDHVLVLDLEEEERATRVEGVRAGTKARISAHSHRLRAAAHAEAAARELGRPPRAAPRPGSR